MTVLHSFTGQDGEEPRALIQATNGNFFGAAEQGGGSGCLGYGCGSLFEFALPDILTSLFSFDSTNGADPIGGLLQSSAGSFYGTTIHGGTSSCDCGTVFNLSIGLGPFVAFVRAVGKVGQTGGILGQGFTGATSVSLNGTPTNFTVVSDTFIRATVPTGAKSGYVTVTTPSGTLTSNVPFYVLP